MKKSDLLLGLILFTVICLGILTAKEMRGAESAKTPSQKLELSAILGIWNEKGPHWSESSFSIMAIGGYYPARYLGVELSAIQYSDEGVFSGNLALRLPISRYITPFLSAGLGICIYGAVHYNFGGGIFVPVAKRMALRLEYRNWDYEGNYGTESTFMGGLCYRF